MKALFLGIYGVLSRHGQECLDPDLVAIYNNMLSRLEGVTVVLHAGWSLSEEMCKSIKEHKLRVDAIARWFEIEPKLERGYEIQCWLNEFEQDPRYAILDSADDVLTSQLPNFFRAIPETGITAEIADRLVAHLSDV